jgi:methionyl-tRNA synthetase
LNISNDDFIRTTEPRHEKVVQAIFEKLSKTGDIYKGFYEGWYCVGCETFWLLSQLVENKCPDCKRAVQKLKEESYFFKLSHYEDKLLRYFEENRSFLSPAFRAPEMVQFVKGGLKDLSVSRIKETWGVPVPFDPKHTTYVWFDALINYASAVGYASDDARFAEYWPADIHFVGKEIFRFHTVIWPAMLMALGVTLPAKVFAHGWWTVEGDKMSKSKGNVVDPVDVVQEYSVDSFRYFILREIPFGADGDFSKAGMKARYNAELANNIGNLFSRTLTLIEKYFDGVPGIPPDGVFVPRLLKARGDIEKAYEKIAFHEVLEHLNNVVTDANRYLEEKAPWMLAKTDKEATAKVLGECLIVLRWLVQGVAPFMPESAEKMWAQCGETAPLGGGRNDIFQDPMAGFDAGRKVRKEGILFPRKA